MDNQFVHNALGSATAGIISRSLTHPLDTAKAMMQSGNGATALRGPMDAMVKTYGKEGLKGLYRGFGAIVVGGTPGTILYLCSYEFFKNRLEESIENRGDAMPSSPSLQTFSTHFASGMLAETVACIIYVPVDVIKERLQVQSLALQSTHTATSGVPYKGSWDALVRILRTERLSGVYKGYAATLASFGPFSAFYFVFYEQFKSWAREADPSYQSSKNKQDGDISFPLLVGCSAGAGALASWITSPLDMAKLRLQIQRGNLASGSSGQVHYLSMWDCLHRTFSESGVRGLFRGAGARVLHFAPATTITMTCYEKCRSFYSRVLSSSAHNK